MSERECTCHPDDSPPRPCKKQFALTECRLSAAQARIAVLEEALEFYADRNYEGYQINITDYGLSTDCGAIIEDAGTIARAALNGGDT